MRKLIPVQVLGIVLCLAHLCFSRCSGEGAEIFMASWLEAAGAVDRSRRGHGISGMKMNMQDKSTFCI